VHHAPGAQGLQGGAVPAAGLRQRREGGAIWAPCPEAAGQQRAACSWGPEAAAAAAAPGSRDGRVARPPAGSGLRVGLAGRACGSGLRVALRRCRAGPAATGRQLRPRWHSGHHAT
jgi:hypothetical protein